MSSPRSILNLKPVEFQSAGFFMRTRGPQAVGAPTQQKFGLISLGLSEAAVRISLQGRFYLCSNGHHDHVPAYLIRCH